MSYYELIVFERRQKCLVQYLADCQSVDSSLAFVNELKLDMRAFLDERVATSIEAAVEKHAARVTQARIDDLIQRTLVQSHAMTISAAVKEGMKGEYMTEEKLKGMFSEISENTPPLR